MAGRRVDDHSFWAGKGGKDSVLPEESKVMKMAEGEGCGDLKRYEDSPEAIKKFQDYSDKKAEENPMRDSYRY